MCNYNEPVYVKDPDGGPDYCRLCGLPCDIHKDAEALLVEHGKDIGRRIAAEAMLARMKKNSEDDFYTPEEQWVYRNEAEALRSALAGEYIIDNLLQDIQPDDEDES